MSTVVRRPVHLLAAAALLTTLVAGVAPAQARPAPAVGAAAVGAVVVGGSVASATAPVPTRCPRTFTRAHHRTCIDRARTAYVRAWRGELAKVGITARAPRVVIWSGSVANPCIDLSEGDVVTGSFYCNKNRTIYASRFDVRYFTKNYAREAARVGVLASDATTAGTTAANLRKGFPLIGATTEFAHEAGHWVQHQSGQLRWYLKRIDGPGFTRSNRYKLASELSADCLAGWVQGRVAVRGTWRSTGIDRWGQHAMMAELGGDLTGLAPGFHFTPESDPLIGYGGSYSRVRFFDIGYAAAVARQRGLATCARAAAAYTHSAVPPHS